MFETEGMIRQAIEIQEEMVGQNEGRIGNVEYLGRRVCKPNRTDRMLFLILL